MIQYYTYLTKDDQCNVYRSVNDKKKYRFLRLENGLKVFIIEDQKKASTYDDNQKCDEIVTKKIRLSKDENSKSNSGINDFPDTKSEDVDKMAATALTVNVGSFSDPKELQGLAHFTEHVVLMGNKEFPVVNEFDNYLNTLGGYSNAHTLSDYTIYEAQVPNTYLDGCLKRFAACFKEPLFRLEHIESEINPLNNEFVDNFVDDEVRFDHFVESCLTKKDHEASHFSWGNYKSLVELPKSKGINVREKMVEFFNKHYKASRMSLVIQSQERLDTVEKMVREYFKDLPTAVNNDLTPEQLDEKKLVENLLSNTNVFAKKDYPFSKETMNNLYIMDSVEDGHQLKLIYCFPPVANLYKMKPLRLLSFSLGYEGQNSLIRFLIKKKLITEFTAGEDETCDFYSSKYHSFLNLSVKLTDEGLEKVDLVVRYINYYIDLMVREGPKENHFNEERLISLTKIRFEDEIPPLTNAVNLSKYLFLYPVEYAIIGPNLIHEFNEDVVKYCLDFIKNQPRLAVILSKKAFKLSNWPVQSDFWAPDIHFKVEPLPEKWNILIENEELVEKLKIPPSNEFIPLEFDLKKQDCFYDYPILIDEDTYYKCYFKNDQIFKTPKACIYLVWQSDYIRQNPEAMVALQFYIKYFLLTIGEYAYPAEMAGLGYSLHLKSCGLELKLNGFNHKLFKLLKLILDNLLKINIDSTLFETIKLETIREYYNVLINNDYLVDNILSFLLNKDQTLLTSNREIVKGLSIQKITEHVLNYFTTAYFQCLIQGNYTKEEAQEIFDYVKLTSLTVEEEMNLEGLKQNLKLQLPTGDSFCYIKSFNKLDENILINNLYQLGKLNEQEIVILDLIMQEMFDPLFNLLRSEKTLAYYLYCKFNRSNKDICSYQIMVKSLADKFTPIHVDEQIEWFIGHFLNENILKMTEDHFKELKEARIKKKQIPFVSLKKETKFNWKEVCDFTYKFNRTKEEVEILKDLKLNQFIEFAKTILLRSPERKKLSVCSIGTGDKSEELFTCLNPDNLVALNQASENDEEKEELNNDEMDIFINLYETQQNKREL